MEGRRHSVDVPISKTILALRRVRSLRDPSTTTNNKYSPSVDNFNWDTNSINAITLGFPNGYDEFMEEEKYGLGLTGLGLMNEIKEEKPRVTELLNGPRSSNCNLTTDDISGWVREIGSLETGRALVPNHFELNRGGVFGNEPLGERYRNVYMDTDLELRDVEEPAGDRFEGGDSCNEPLEGSVKSERVVGHRASHLKNKNQRQFRSSRAAMGDIMSRVGSPCFSVNHVLADSCGGTSLFGTEDVDAVDYNSRGCGISCCWSGTPKLRQSDVEDQPLLLSGEAGESFLSEKCNSWKLRNNELALYSDTPKSLAQKFRPKCFSDLVGQHIVAESLLSAISKGRIASFYLFHGPRGTGKSCASRIFAAALNCLSVEEDRPCGLCSECVLLYSGRSKEVKEVDSLRINRRDKLRSLIKSATMPTVLSSQYKVFIVDDCHLIREETWAALLNILANISQQVVFIMITPHLDKLPRAAVAQCQKYHFPRIKEIDIANQLGKICAEERIEFEEAALNFVATKSNGSLRDAEMMLEQLCLLGKRITLSLVYEIIGIVSDDELLDLLDLALSSDTSNTVKRARELMRSRIDPMQLISQLANLIMDILAGKSQEDCSEVRKKFYSNHSSEASLQQLNNALKILSEAEKQLRTSKSQTTWLTVALLQLSSVGSSFLDPNDLKCDKSIQLGDSDYCSRSSTSETLKHLVLSNESHKVGIHDDKETIESIWKRATSACQSNSLRSFLQKHGKLASISFNQGLAVVELEFHNPAHVSKAEKSWKLIANTIQSVLGRNVELRINLVHCASLVKYSEHKKRSFGFFNCSGKMRRQSKSSNEHGSDPSDSSNPAATREQYVESLEACSSNSASQHSHDCCLRKEAASIIRNNDGNALWHEHRDIYAPGGKKQPGCFPRCMKPRKKTHSPSVYQSTCLSLQPLNSIALSTPQKTPSGACSCTSDHHRINFSKDDRLVN